MPPFIREKTSYPGVFYIEGTSSNGKPERIFYMRYRREGKIVEEKAGRQFKDDMTAARAARLRTKRIEGDQLTNQEKRKKEQQKIEAEANKYTVGRLWALYIESKTLKGFNQDESRYRLYIKPSFEEMEPKDITPMDIDRLRLKRMKGMSPQSVKLALALLRRIIRFGSDRGICKGLSFKLEMPKVNNEKNRGPFAGANSRIDQSNR